jgi:shikimate kinase
VRVVSSDSNIFLVGPMGAGKSTIGRSLASLLNREFADSDHEIEVRTGASIPLIFEVEGEDGFRRRESTVLQEISVATNLVIATGGGIVLAEENRRLLRERGLVVYLRAPLETLWRRTRHDRNRPLLQTDDRRRTLEEILRKRDPLYTEVADVVIQTDHRSPTTVVREIADKLSELMHADPAAQPG